MKPRRHQGPQDLMVSVVVFLTVTGALVYGQDEYMTCSRPVKSSRAGRFQVDLPCRGMDRDGESWCNLPGPDYPWHAVRRFVFENQGLMRRMYGEVRQLSVLRMEFSGENNFIEQDARNFDELFKPVSVTPSMLSNLMSTTAHAEAEVSRAINIEEIVAPEGGSEDMASLEEQQEQDDQDQPTTLEFKTTTTEEPNVNNISMEIGGAPGAAAASADSLSTGGDQISTDEIPTTTEEGIINLSENNNKNSSDTPDSEIHDEKTRQEGQILFQDFDRSSTTTTTTTEEPRVRGNRPGVNACPVKEEVVAPYWANNTRGEILALLNLYPFEQYIHWEKCTNEHRQMYCRDGCRCEQQYRLHRLLAFDPHNECRGIFSDWFRFPSCCVCKCYFDEFPPERVSFNRSPRILLQTIEDNFGESDEPDVNGVDDSHFYYKYSNSLRQPRK